ncbi:MAG: YrdB family protein, partial [Thermanaerothrix sp.]|nr:YrdB family protein [Thermanaerothrix sp.]
GLGAPVLVGIVWGVFLAPKSPMRLDMPWSLLVELLIWGLALAALFGVDRANLALTLGVVYVLNKVLMLIWKQ